MIYQWGLVVSGKAKHLAVCQKDQDSGSFRPSWGELCLVLMMTREAPVLLMSATCPIPHFNSIMRNLSMKIDDVCVLRGELARPEITILRVTVPNMGSLPFLRHNFPNETDVPTEELLPTLVYSGSRKGTMTALAQINRARGTPGAEFDPLTPVARRYHSCSGELTKLERMQDFSDRKFPIMSCTSALGLGTNYEFVRQVVQLGRAGVPELAQIIGRVGRNKNKGLAVVYIERKASKGGLNTIEDFEGKEEQSDDDMMNAWAITPVCLRVALVLGNT